MGEKYKKTKSAQFVFVDFFEHWKHANHPNLNILIQIFLNSLNKFLIYFIKQFFVDVVGAIQQVFQSESSGGEGCNFDAPKSCRLPNN